MKTDYHVHTRFSNDADADLYAYCEKAIQLSFDELLFSDHVDFEMYGDDKQEYIVDFDAYQKELVTLRSHYKNSLCIKKGFELGVQLQTIPKFKKLMENCKVDFTILSCHQIDGLEFWNNTYQVGRSPHACFHDYYDYIYKLISAFQDFNVLGHLDLLKRYCPYDENIDNTHKIKIQSILKKLIQDGKGIEVNTSGIAYGLQTYHPSKQILKWYYELGGKIITIGSDAHQVDQLGYHVEEAKQELKKLGFKEFTTFTDRKPVFHKL
ncbi:MAG: histidinol-phosphatase HisJ family protein [Breznakia sp.]